MVPSTSEPDEISISLIAHEPLIDRPVSPQTVSSRASSRILLRLYISHSLSTWNSRMFEFGAVLFLASIFPGTLLYASIYALVRSLSAVVLSSWLGSVVDRSNRLTALRHSIVWQRLPVAGSCACFVVLLASANSTLRILLFLATVVLACFEKLAATANTVAVERDWVDLFCKLIAPIFISLVDGFSTKAAIWTTLGVNVSCVAVEYVAIAQVYASVSQLGRNMPAAGSEGALGSATETRSVAQLFKQRVKDAAAPWKEYTQSPLFLASFALSLLYLTVLSFGATMVTYLLHTGFTPLQVSAMRIGAVAAELSGTWAAPFIMNRIGPIRSGLWFLNWQFVCLVTAVAAFALLDPSSQVVAVSLIVGVALSRVGLWGFDLSVQFLVQEGVDEDCRARFSATEMALQNIFELLSFATTIAFPSPEQFKYPVYISYGAIAMAAACFAAYVRKERGHLLHTSKCLGGDKKRLVPGEVLYHRVP
ncbi:hypothetical protein ASPACDRAFT_25830 [Aspergillus aculeatus ATCC 16872]|uniref:Solute carrier family 40 member n=1 Tax=Aspergillus aculeatus (strain ATCC 16872 / CBS 172.66 / WB 5094) TaxID=690307 RepID=A0A1L9WZT9_ASPA1|nr:uncharacterized protein ASPACDRAFT_25830 [Aspergillus aculeatus ATCC 16872]OJK01654.1 hypothetical protein ASPACDRAFT_25830 [Aspergillus aculeatus ATCC 16872]